MAVEITLPELGENITGGDVVRILVAVGDAVAVDQPVIELETDKASFEVPATSAGTVAAIHVTEGARAAVGQVILTLDGDGAASAPAPAVASKTPPAAAPAPAPASVPAPAPAPAVQAAPPSPSGSAGAATSSVAAVHEPVGPRTTPVSHPESDVLVSAAIAPSIEELAATVKEDVPPAHVSVPAAPSVRRLAREIGVDISAVRGSGPAGRISLEDVKQYAKALLSGAAPGASTIAGRPVLPDFARWGPVDRQPMSTIRRKTAENMEAAWRVPVVTQHDAADITALEDARRRHASKAEALGGKLTMTAILLTVSAAALRKYPQFNASVDMERGEIVLKGYTNIGVAVDTERGLLVPVLRDVDRKSMLSLSVELQELAGKARAKKLTPDEMMGGCFTITNLGGIGGTSFTPIINAPEAAILGVSRSAMQPVWMDGAFQPRLMLPLSLTYDHRIIDGADAARFLRFICEALEDPFVLALER